MSYVRPIPSLARAYIRNKNELRELEWLFFSTHDVMETILTEVVVVCASAHFLIWSSNQRVCKHRKENEQEL